jgi:hypothetical protein
LHKSSIRLKPLLLNGKYRRDGVDDPRFVDYSAAAQPLVTSGGVNDSGMFETNLRDERFLPFEGAGAISTWGLQLPRLPQFDYMSITDVILHVRYTLSAVLNNKVVAADRHDWDFPQALLFSFRYDFASAWAAHVNNPSQPISFTLLKEHFPYLVQVSKKLIVDSMKLYWRGNLDGSDLTTVDMDQISNSLNRTGTALVSFSMSQTESLPEPFLILSYHADPSLPEDHEP